MTTKNDNMLSLGDMLSEKFVDDSIDISGLYRLTKKSHYSHNKEPDIAELLERSYDA